MGGKKSEGASLYWTSHFFLFMQISASEMIPKHSPSHCLLHLSLSLSLTPFTVHSFPQNPYQQKWDLHHIWTSILHTTNKLLWNLLSTCRLDCLRDWHGKGLKQLPHSSFIENYSPLLLSLLLFTASLHAHPCLLYNVSLWLKPGQHCVLRR